MGTDDPFDRAQQLINWAGEAIEEGQAAFLAAMNSDYFTLAIENDTDTGVTTERLYLAKPLPSLIERKFTEALNNLRNSFDQSLFAVCKAIGKPVKDAHYPWADNPDPSLTYRLQHKTTGRELIPSELWDAIRAHQPYPRGDTYTGGDDINRAMAAAANRKHTVGLVLHGRINEISAPGGISIETGPENVSFVFKAPSWDPVKNEMIISVYKNTVVKAHQGYSFVFDICFDVPPPLGDVAASIALRIFMNKAQNVLDSFKLRARQFKEAAH